RLHGLLERVADRPEDDVRVGGEGLLRGTGTTSPCTDQADFQFRVVRLAEKQVGETGDSRGGGGACDEATAIGRNGSHDGDRNWIGSGWALLTGTNLYPFQ